MIKSFTKKQVACGLLAASLGASMLVGSAGADPQQYDGFVGVGSDTTQDIMNAFAGYSNGVDYTPIQANASTNAAVRGDRQIISFDAIKPPYNTSNCIVSKLNGPAYYRPNGSGTGRKALNQSAGLGGGWTGLGGCGTLVDISGQIDFARSSSLGGNAGSDVTFIPLGRDALSFAYYKPGGTVAAVTDLTRAQLAAIYSGSTRQVINGVTMIPCGIQLGSGTQSSWNGVVQTNPTNEDAATAQCNATQIDPVTNLTGRAQENEGPALKTRGDALNATGPLAGTEFQVIIGFSASAFISKSAGLATPLPGPGITLGSISNDGAGNNLGSPISGTAPNFTPVANFYNNGVFGRTVYNVLPTAVAAGAGNTPMKQIFVDTNVDPLVNTSKICQATATIQAYGYLPTADCGSIATTRAWETGAA